MKKLAKKKKVKEPRTELFQQLLDHMPTQDDWDGLQELSTESGVSTTCLYFWVSGKTAHPRINTMVKVATALGLEFHLYKPRPVGRALYVVK